PIGSRGHLPGRHRPGIRPYAGDHRLPTAGLLLAEDAAQPMSLNRSAFVPDSATARLARAAPSFLRHRIARSCPVRDAERHTHHHGATDHVIPEPGNIREVG